MYLAKSSFFIVLGVAVFSLAQPLLAQTVILDNDNGASEYQEFGGGWFPSANATPQGASSRLNEGGGASARAEWSTNLPITGAYDVAAWWVESFNRANPATYEITHLNGTTAVDRNQTVPGSSWVDLGNFDFASTQTALVTLRDAGLPGGTFVSADAIRFIRTGDISGGGGGNCVGTPTFIQPLSSPSGCGTCGFNLLPGADEAHPDTTYYITSDLPEIFESTGVLYSTQDILPDNPANSVPLSLRTQTKTGGFTSIDDSFDLFLFHISPSSFSTAYRIVVYVENNGAGSVQIDPEQAIVSDGIIGTVHQMESNLGIQTLEESWDTPVGSSVTIPSGNAAVVAYSKVFGTFGTNGPDFSQNRNCFGRVRGNVTNLSANPVDLDVKVIAILGSVGETVSAMEAKALALVNTAAESGESAIDIATAPAGCALRRALGVADSIVWRSDVVQLDHNNIVPGSAGETFQMALAEIQSQGCSEGRQTEPMLLHPGFARGDNIGNYHVEYRTTFRLMNNHPTNNVTYDLDFGKTSADVGLAWQIVIDSSEPTDAAVDAAPVRTGWAGPSQANLERSFFEFDGGDVTVGPCSEQWVSIRFIVLGNASLPFQIRASSTGVVPVIMSGFALE